MTFSWYDPSKVAAALANQAPGGDGRNILQGQNLESILNAISGVSANPGSTQAITTDGWGDAGNATTSNVYTPGTYSANGQTLYGLLGGATNSGTDFTDQASYDAAVKAKAISMGLDPSKNYVTSSFDNPTGNGSKDQANGIYQLDANGNATPIGAYDQYNPSAWIDTGRDATKLAATTLLGGAYAGGAFGAAGASAGTGAATADAMDASAIDGLGTGMSTATAGGAATGTAGAGSAALDSSGTSTFGNPADMTVPGNSATLANSQSGGLLSSLSPTQQSMLTKAGMGAATSAIQGGNPVKGAAMGAADGYVDSSGQWIPGINNSSLINAGIGLAGAAAGAAGAGSGLNSATTTNKSTVDPRVAQYIYGANGNSGLLGNVNNIMNSQLATGGLNSTQQQGLNMQLQALQNPAYTAGLNQMRAVGNGLLGTSQANNPFTSGQAATPYSQGSAQPSQQAMPPGFQPMATQLNPRPQMTGLLGNLRPMGQ